MTDKRHEGTYLMPRRRTQHQIDETITVFFADEDRGVITTPEIAKQVGIKTETVKRACFRLCDKDILILIAAPRKPERRSHLWRKKHRQRPD